MEYSDKARAQGGIPVKYTKFCEDYHDYLAASSFTSHILHKSGIKCEVGWAGKTMSFTENKVIRKVYLFVGCLPYSKFKNLYKSYPRSRRNVFKSLEKSDARICRRGVHDFV